MSTYRVHKTGNYTSMSNFHLDDPELSLKSIGLLSYMLRLPDDWQFSTQWLARQHRDGIDAVRSCLRELEGRGYIRRSQGHSDHGHFSKTEFEVYERPPDAEDPPRRDFPYTVEPYTDLPHAVNPTLPNTKELPKTDNTNPPKAPQRGAGAGKIKRGMQATHKTERFEKFWEAYPRHESKQAAARAWDKLAPNDELLTAMARALAKQLKSEEWQRGIGIPYASTWLNQRRWEDEPYSPPQARQDEAAVYTGEVYPEWS